MPPKPPSPTHFLCIPLAGAQLAKSLASFNTDVTSPLSFGVPEGAVRPLGTLHLTLGVMALKKEGVEKAVELLKSLRPRDILTQVRSLAASNTTATALKLSGDGGGGDGKSDGFTTTTTTQTSGLSITMQGLHSIQPAAKATVLYAPPSDTDGILYEFCKQLRKPFQDSGLMIDENRPLLLHATIINTIYIKNGSGGAGRGRRREKPTIDARDLVSRYEDYLWAENMPITRVAICRMGAKKIEGTDDAAYEVEAEVEI